MTIEKIFQESRSNKTDNTMSRTTDLKKKKSQQNITKTLVKILQHSPHN